MALRHAVIRVGSLLSTPPGLGLLLLAAVGAQIVLVVLLGIVTVASSDHASLPSLAGLALLWLFGVYALWTWTWLLARPFSGARGTWGDRPWPLPALPLGFRGRLVAEAVAAVVLVSGMGLLVVAVTAWAVPFLVGGDLLRSFARGVLQALFARPEGALWYAAVLGSLALPVVLAWLAPIREDGPYYGRSFLVAALVGLGVLWIPGPFLFRAVVSGLGLSALIVATQGLTLTPTFRRESPSAGDLSRPALDPEARFRRDRWERLRRPALRYGVPAACLLVASLGFLGLADVRPGFHLLVVLAAVGLLAGVYKRPVGIDLFATDRSARSPSLFSGAYARAWSLLPLRPETVRRSVYLHGFVSAALVWLLFFAYTRLAHALGLSFGPWHRDLPLALAVPCAAGLLLCGAVGDSVRGTLSALALFLLPLAHVVTLVLASQDLDPASVTAVNVRVLLVLGIVGGLPPLVHLRAAGGRHA